MTSTRRSSSRRTSSTCCAASWPGRPGQREHVALGTNTDPYQRAEGRYRLMPGVIGALADSGTPFSILTKGTLLRRDIPLLVEAAQRRAGRPRRLHGHLGRRPAPRPRARRADPAGPAGPGPGAHRRRPAVRRLPRAGAARADRRHRAPRRRARRDRRRRRHRGHRHPAAPAAGRAGVVHGLAAAGPPGAGRRATSSCTPGAPTCRPSTAPGCRSGSRRCCARHGLDRQSGGAARRPTDPIATGVPGDEEVGFPAGSLPTGGMPGVRPKGEVAPAAVRRPADVPSSCRCSERRLSPPAGDDGAHRPGGPHRTPRGETGGAPAASASRR